VRARFGGRYDCHPIKPRLSLHDQIGPTYLLPCPKPVLSMVASAFGYTGDSHYHRALRLDPWPPIALKFCPRLSSEEP